MYVATAPVSVAHVVVLYITDGQALVWFVDLYMYMYKTCSSALAKLTPKVKTV